MFENLFFVSEQIQRVVDACQVRPAILQVEAHVCFAQQRLQEFCRRLGIKLTAFSPLGSPARPAVVQGKGGIRLCDV